MTKGASLSRIGDRALGGREDSGFRRHVSAIADPSSLPERQYCHGPGLRHADFCHCGDKQHRMARSNVYFCSEVCKEAFLKGNK